MPKRKQTAQDWAQHLQPYVAYCYNCQARDSGEWVWVLGRETELDDFLRNHDVPEVLLRDVASQLHCLNCGTQLDLSCDIGLKSDEEEAADEQWREWHREYSRQLNDFVLWLERFPYLGVDHPLGKKLLKQIKLFPETSHTQSDWWRARRVQGPVLLTSGQMGPPPTPPGSEGRYSHHGQTVFYLASSKEDAAAEVLHPGECLVWVQQFTIKNRTRLLDLRRPDAHEDYGSLPVLLAGLAWSRAHVAPSNPDSEWKPQYFLPRFIADCARRHGFRGIVFESPKHYGENLVLFDWEPLDIIPDGDPHLLMWNRPDDKGSLF